MKLKKIAKKVEQCVINGTREEYDTLLQALQDKDHKKRSKQALNFYLQGLLYYNITGVMRLRAMLEFEASYMIKSDCWNTMYLGYFFYDIGFYKQAKTWFTESIKLAADFNKHQQWRIAKIYELLAVCCYKLGDMREFVGYSDRMFDKYDTLDLDDKLVFTEYVSIITDELTNDTLDMFVDDRINLVKKTIMMLEKIEGHQQIRHMLFKLATE